MARKRITVRLKSYIDEQGLTHYICPYCRYDWIPRKPNLKSCPLCKRKFVLVV
jgi:rubrerythrin